MDLTLKAIIRDIFGKLSTAVLVRLILLCHTLLSIWRTVDTMNQGQYWYLLNLILFQFAEGIYTIVYKRGEENKWVCPCFFFYLLSTIPSIWILELDRLSRYDEIYQNSNLTRQAESLSTVQGVSIPIKFSADVWVSVIEQSLLFLLILCRWILPRGEITRDQLSQLLFVYIGMASDIMELFVLFDEETVRRDKILVYIILVVWSISLLQFCLVLTATRNPKKARVVTVSPESPQERPKKKKDLLIMCLRTEVWSLLVTFLMQDGPFLCVRLYTLLRYNLITYNIIFFACKNILVVMLLGYRLLVVCCRDDENNSDKDEDDEEIIVEAPKKIGTKGDISDEEKPSNGNFISVMNSPGRNGKF